ncbi:uncharacterized protein LOC134230774 [Saccostrea cucullata]|uniref:uncharacterized protein LOC134230774 n=1 Tax=Saccostrea cuccullata TaxID=36930 RepID=UPI002ED49F2F
METEDGTVLDLVFAQYYFEYEPHSFIPNPHKNSKQLEKYQRTSESTKRRIQTLVDENKRPKDIFHSIIEEQGGIEHIPGGLFLPRDRQQIKNLTKMKKSNTGNFDSLAELLDMAKAQEESKDKFVRELRCAPEFTVFLASNRQLKEMEKYCTNAKNFSILGIDTTFNIGAFYVTVTNYRNPMLTSKNGNEPVMIGPILIHQKKNFDSYFKLSSSILQICPEMKNLKAFGTDGDKNLSDAFEVCFTSSKHLLCDIHMQDNIERKLKDLGITKSKAREYIDDIFGKRTGEVKIKGLVDCMSYEEFDHELQNLCAKWKSLHQNGNLFFKYFVEFKAELIKSCMSAELRSLSGLGFLPKPYNQNANECMNSVIKSDLKKEGHHSKINEKEVVLALEKIVKRQEAEVKLSLIGKGEYRLKKEYQHLQVPDNIYWRKTPLQREAVFTKMLKEPLQAQGGDVMCHTDTDQEIENLQEHPSLPVSPENSQITNIPFQILKTIFEEAQTIIHSVNGIVEMPGYTDRSSLFILNVSHPKDPYKVCKLKTTSFFTCENRCHRFSSFKLCSHTIAAANYCDILQDFIKIYNEKYKTLGPSLTKMALANMPKSRGQKPKGTSVRKGQNNKCNTEIIEFETPHRPSLEQPFHLTFLAGIVKKCYGCGQCFSDRHRSPPNDLILKRFDHRKYLSPNSKTYKTTPTLQNTYYHLNSDCCRRTCPLFEISRDVIVHGEIMCQLTADHKNVLQKLNISIQ